MDKRRSKQKHRVKGQDVVVAELMAQGDDADQRFRVLSITGPILISARRSGCLAKTAPAQKIPSVTMVVTMCEA